MHYRNRRPQRLLALAAVGFSSLTLAACGSSGDATTLLKETFSGKHTVNSGNLNLGVTMSPSGSSTLTSPISLSFGGPFQSLGTGKLPESNFTLGLNALGRNVSLGVLSTGTSGYVTLQGNSYQLPAATFQRLESSFSQLTSTGSGSGSSTLNKLGIHPLDWLQDPTIVGDETVAGTQTTHIRAKVNVSALLNDLNTFLQKASSTGVTGASRLSGGIPQSTQTRIASEVQNPSFDVWTGKSDKTLRKLTLGLTVPVSGQISTLLGGLRSAGIGLNMQYANLNEPQTITAPTNVRPYSEFTSQVRNFVQTLQSAVAGSTGASGAGSAGTGTTGSGTSGSGSSSGVQAYSKCIQAAGNDVTKMQQCAPLLSGGG